MLGDLDPARVRRDNGEFFVAVALRDIRAEDGQRHEMVHRPVEEPLDLVRMQVHRHQAVRTGGLEEVRHQPRRDRLASTVLLVLSAITVEG